MTDGELPDDPDARLRRWFERDAAVGAAAERRQLEQRIAELEAALAEAAVLNAQQAAHIDQLQAAQATRPPVRVVHVVKRVLRPLVRPFR